MMNIEVRMATNRDRLEVEKLHNYVHGTMEESGLKQEYLMPLIEENGFWHFDIKDCAVAYVDKKLVGASGAIMHGKELFQYSGILEKHPDIISKLFIYQHPGYRSLSEFTKKTGRRLSMELTDLMCKYLLNEDKRFAITTTHPDHPAKKTLFDMGFTQPEQAQEEIMARKKYRRILLQKDLGFKHPDYLLKELQMHEQPSVNLDQDERRP